MGKGESCSRIKDGNGKLELGEDEVRRIWKEYLEGLYNIYTQEQVALRICRLESIQRGNYFGEEPIRRTEVELRVGKSNDGKAAGRDYYITGEMVKGGGDMVVDWIWRLYKMTFESGVVPED